MTQNAADAHCKWRRAAEGEPGGPSPYDLDDHPAVPAGRPTCVVVLTHPGGRRMLSGASLMTKAQAEDEASSWRRTQVAGAGPWSAEVCRVVPAAAAGPGQAEEQIRADERRRCLIELQARLTVSGLSISAHALLDGPGMATPESAKGGSADA